jgi:uncharacterized C2H2 Zn-finger protein
MGRTKGAKNKTTVVKVQSPVRKRKAVVTDEKAEVDLAEFVAVPLLETPLFMCRRCQLAFETQDEYAQHSCFAQLYTVLEEEPAAPETAAEPEEQFESIEEEETPSPSKKPRKPYKKREKKETYEKSSKDPAKCPTCGKTFTRKYHLERHLVHTSCNPGTIEKQEFACEVCNKVFSRIDNLRMHLRAHLGQKSRSRDFQCPYCEKSFYGSSLLNIHVRTQTRKLMTTIARRLFYMSDIFRRKTIQVRLG